jgi:hypothetical protein
MPRKHLFVVVVLIAAVAVAGLLAATQTVALGRQAAAAPTDGSIQARMKALDRLEASLRRSLTKHPPALPAARSASPRQAAAPQLVYVRQAPPSAASSRGEREHEAYEHEGEGDDD